MPFPRCNSLCVATFRIHTICSCVPAHPNPICLSQGSQGIVCAIFAESGRQALIVKVHGSEFQLASQLSHPPSVSHNSALAFCISLFALRHSVLVSHISLPTPTMKFIMPLGREHFITHDALLATRSSLAYAHNASYTIQYSIFSHPQLATSGWPHSFFVTSYSIMRTSNPHSLLSHA